MRLRNILIGVFVVSVLGLVYIQYQYLRIGLNLAREQFEDKMGAVTTDLQEGLVTENELTFLMGKAITEDDTYFKLSLDSLQDASSHFLDDFIRESLVKGGVTQQYSYVLRNREGVEYLSSPSGMQEDRGVVMRFPVSVDGYLPELTGSPMVLELKFRDLNGYFLSQLNGLTIPSVIFLLAISLVTFYVLRGFLQQRSLISVTNEFINNLTHELKTPVFSIGLATKLLADGKDVNRQEVAGIIRGQLDKLNAQIDRVLELAGLEEKGEVLRKERTGVRELVKEVSDRFGEVAKLEGIHYEAALDDDPGWVMGMKGHLMNAVDILLDNARKYSEDPREIRLGYEVTGKHAIITIGDNGFGIAEEEQKKVFEKFYRIGSGDLHRVKGYGLGLHYVQRIAALHKGKAVLESTPGEGSEFRLILPLDK